nr:hypothetical protein [Tanacetum cinerariifolium]
DGEHWMMMMRFLMSLDWIQGVLGMDVISIAVNYQGIMQKRHAFHLWLIMQRCLKTQDKLRPWDVDVSTDVAQLRCSLCGSQQDSHEHLFFECTCSTTVWNYIRNLDGMEHVPTILEDTVLWFNSMGNKHSFNNIVGWRALDDDALDFPSLDSSIVDMPLMISVLGMDVISIVVKYQGIMRKRCGSSDDGNVVLCKKDFGRKECKNAENRQTGLDLRSRTFDRRSSEPLRSPASRRPRLQPLAKGVQPLA